MSIQSEINRINNNVQDSLDVCRDAGVSVASDANSNDLPGATRALASSFLPLAGGNMTGAGPVQYPVVGSAGASQHFISAGGGYSANSGRYGVKLICCDQPDTQTGMGQDLTGLPGGYELSIAGGRNADGNTGYISFAMHSVNSKVYDRLGYFDNNGNFFTKGQITEGGTPLVNRYALKTEIPSIPVSSVNGKTGAVSINANDVGAVKFEYYPGDMNSLTEDGHYRLDANSNLPEGAYWGQALVMKGAAWADTTAQIVFGYRNGFSAWRGGQIVGGAWTWSEWVPFAGGSGNFLPITGGTLSGSTTMADGSQYKFTSGAATRGSNAGSLVLSGDSSNGKTGGVFIRPTSTSSTSGGVKIIGGAILPEDVGNMNLGASNAKWKDLYLAGSLSDGTKSIAIKDIFPVSGGTLTGNLSGHYIKGTWLQTLSDNHSSNAASEVCVQIGGWIYKRTNNEFRADLGGTADTNYTTLQTRGTSLHASDTNPSVNGAICWTYK